MKTALEETDLDPFGGLPDDAPPADIVPMAEVLPAKVTPEEERERRLKSIEDEIFQDAAKIVADTMKAREVEPDAKEAPIAWVTEEGLTEAEARKRLRVATGAHFSLKDSPAYIQLANKTFASIVRARATEKQAPKTLNLNFVQMSGALPQYPEKKIG